MYKRASCTGESLTLENSKVKLVLYRRLCGWGFGELYSPEGKLLAVLDHFGELLLRDMEIPMRLEAKEYDFHEENGVKTYDFSVETTVPTQMLKGTSFEQWVHFPVLEPVLKGVVSFSLGEDDNFINYNMKLTSEANIYARYLRCLWLLCGEGSYGAEKTDALLPGVDWALGEEWTSGTDFFKDPWANRSVPHPNKVASPVMAISHGGDAVAVSYSLDTPLTRWFNYAEQYAQPVFAAPNFVQRMNNSLIGIMIPDVKSEEQENKPYADVPLEIHIGQHFEFSAQLYTVKGSSLDALVDYVKRTGLPKVTNPKYTPGQALEAIANAYNTNLWHTGEGFGIKQRESDTISRGVPGFLRRYVSEHKGERLAEELTAKIAWCDEEKPAAKSEEEQKEAAVRRGEELLSWKKEDGTFRFEPDGRHYTKDDFRVARAFIEPMGGDGETALQINILPAFELLRLYKTTGDKRFADAARRALDYCLQYIRPEAGDYWETPLHAPNLLAAGTAANAYYYAYEIFKDDNYKKKAVWFLRSILAFTHLREPKGVKSLYNTKPCLCSSDWYFANWVRDFVQWEALSVFAQSSSLGFDWAKIDPEIDWNTFRYGITTATYNWMVDGSDGRWRPHNLPSTYENYKKGDFNSCFADTFNSVTGNLGGMCIPPAPIADNLYACKQEGN